MEADSIRRLCHACRQFRNEADYTKSEWTRLGRTTCRDCQHRIPDLLYWFLGLRDHAVPGACWELLTMHELANLKCVSKDLRNQLVTIDYTHCSDGSDYMLPYPGIPGVLTKESGGGGGLFAHQLASLQAMYEVENRSNEYGALRGGIFGDAPGLYVLFDATDGSAVNNNRKMVFSQ
jgi:hypothetical protein